MSVQQDDIIAVLDAKARDTLLEAKKVYADLITKELKTRGLTQRAAAKVLNIRQSRYNLLTGGRLEFFSLDALVIMAGMIGFTSTASISSQSNSLTVDAHMERESLIFQNECLKRELQAKPIKRSRKGKGLSYEELTEYSERRLMMLHVEGRCEALGMLALWTALADILGEKNPEDATRLTQYVSSIPENGFASQISVPASV